MKPDENSWLDRVKDHKWTIMVVIICVFAGIYYFSMEASSSSDSNTSIPTSSPGTPYQTPSATPTAIGTATPSTKPSPTATIVPIPVGTAQQAPTTGDWRPTANAFAKAWANPKVGQQAWLDALKPTVTSNLYNEFTTTDVGRVRQLEVSDITSDAEDYAGVNATVSFKNTDFTIKIHLTPLADMSWRVSVVTS